MFCETLRTTPAPPHVGHDRVDVPGSAPLVPQRSHGSATSSGDRYRRSGERLLELDLDDGLDIASALCALPRSTPAEQVLPEERGEHVGQAPEIREHRLVAASLEARLPEAVIRRPALGIGEHLVRLGDVAEPEVGIGCGRDVRVELARECPEARLISASLAERETPNSS